MKHLDLRLYWLRDKVEHGMLTPDFIPTGEMIADCLTKCVPAPKVRFCREQTSVLAWFLSICLSTYTDMLDHGGVLDIYALVICVII